MGVKLCYAKKNKNHTIIVHIDVRYKMMESRRKHCESEDQSRYRVVKVSKIIEFSSNAYAWLSDISVQFGRGPLNRYDVRAPATIYVNIIKQESFLLYSGSHCSPSRSLLLSFPPTSLPRFHFLATSHCHVISLNVMLSFLLETSNYNFFIPSDKPFPNNSPLLVLLHFSLSSIGTFFFTSSPIVFFT